MGPAIALFAQTVIFWFRHRHLDDTSYMTYDDDEEEETTNMQYNSTFSSEKAEYPTEKSPAQ